MPALPDELAEDLVGKILDLPRFGSGTGLHRVEQLCCDLLDGPWMSGLDAIKVTGSNGKGSVVRMASSILHRLGVRCGTYSSPHLFRFNERIAVGGRPIDSAALANAIGWALDRASAYEAAFPGDVVGRFEAITAAAIHHFALERPTTLVAEVGIGGRFDPTRIIPGLTVGLTSLDTEHTELLGGTAELIAFDKADLCPGDGTLVAGLIDREVLRRLGTYCRLNGIRLVETRDAYRTSGLRFEGDGMRVDVESDGLSLPDLRIGILGAHQVGNAVVAIALVRDWVGRNLSAVGVAALEAAIRQGLGDVDLPGRFERVRQNPDVFIDLAHTPEAVAALAAAVASALPGRRIVLVTGVSYDKNADEILAALAPIASRVICTAAHHKGRPAGEIASMVRSRVAGVPVVEVERIETAVHAAVEMAAEDDMTVLVAGGLFLAIEAAHALRGRDPRGLRFG